MVTSIKQDILAGEDMRGEDKLRFTWNSLLIAELIPQAYGRLLAFVSRLITPLVSSPTTEQSALRLLYYGFPDALKSPQWKPMVQALYILLQNRAVLWGGDGWVAPSNAILVVDDKGILFNSPSHFVRKKRCIV